MRRESCVPTLDPGRRSYDRRARDDRPRPAAPTKKKEEAAAKERRRDGLRRADAAIRLFVSERAAAQHSDGAQRGEAGDQGEDRLGDAAVVFGGEGLRRLGDELADGGRRRRRFRREQRRRVVLLVERQQRALEARDGHSADERDVRVGLVALEVRVVEVLEGRHVDDDGAVLERVGVQLVRLRGHAEHHDVGPADRLDGRRVRFGHGALDHDVDGVDVDGVHRRAVVREHRRERPADDLRAVHHRAHLALERGRPSSAMTPTGVAVRRSPLVDADVLEALDDGEGRARHDGLVRPRAVHEAHVAVERRSVRVAEPLDVLLGRDAVAQLVVHRAAEKRRRGAEDGVVDEDAVHAGVGVRLVERRLQSDGLHLADLVVHAVLRRGAPRPLGVLARRRVAVREEAHEPRRDAGHHRHVAPDLRTERLGDHRRVDARHARRRGGRHSAFLLVFLSSSSGTTTTPRR
mmetsp:Transcript_78/g.288  ORF Transcript_78/g.288 Transcript_78/m.288 type:complete len:463 (+) Transcript_78:1734-3122(+)